MICSGVNVVLNITLNLILVRSMAHNGLALATSIAALGAFLMLYYNLKKYEHIQILKSKRKLIKIIVAAVVAVGGSALFYNVFLLTLSKIVPVRFVQLSLAIGVAAVIYVALLYFFKIEELKILKQLFKR